MSRYLAVVILLILSRPAFAQADTSPAFVQWEKESSTDKRLLPRFGFQPKSLAEQQSDSVFVKSIMSGSQYTSRRAASDHLIELGFQYYYRNDLKTAMYRFNQAYLLDSTNGEDYWGYGAIYMRLGMLQLAASQYETGLTLSPKSSHLLTDYATIFLAKYYQTRKSTFLDTAIDYLKKSYSIDAKDQNTLFKLSICYLNLGQCADAWKFYDVCMGLGGAPITEEYKEDLRKTCPRN